MFFIKVTMHQTKSSKNLIQWYLHFLTIKYDSMYSKKSAQFVDLNASTELAGVVSVKQSQQIDFVCLLFSSPNAKTHVFWVL